MEYRFLDYVWLYAVTLFSLLFYYYFLAMKYIKRSVILGSFIRVHSSSFARPPFLSRNISISICISLSFFRKTLMQRIIAVL